MFTGVVNLLTFKWLCSRVVRGEGRRRDLGRQSRNLESRGECYGLLSLVTAHAIARRANVLTQTMRNMADQAAHSDQIGQASAQPARPNEGK